MSKWLNNDEFEQFANKKAAEAENDTGNDNNGFYRKWKSPPMGTQDKAKEYTGRFLPDPVKGFYREYFYHGFYVGEKFTFFVCEKTYGMDKYCPFCEANKILYQGNDADKAKAGDYRRKNRFVTNWFVVDDPRDAEVKDENYRVNGKTLLYEFPGAVESKVSNEITDKKNGYGKDIFNPEDGYDFVLKIKAKPKDKKGKEWPDYGDSMFARRKSPICETAEGIEKAMADRVDLEKYIDSMRLTVEEMENLLKAEMLWDDVARSFEKNYKGVVNSSAPSRTSEPVKAESKPAPEPVKQNDPDDDLPDYGSTKGTTAPSQSFDDDSDDADALLAELSDM